MHRIDTFVPNFFSCVRGTHIVVTPEIFYEVLHVPKVVHLDYPSCEHLRIVSKDKLSSCFCETPFSWGDCQNTPCSGFAKGLRFPPHFIISLIDVHRDMTTYDKLSFPSAIMQILRHFSVSYPKSPHFFVIGAIDAATVRWSAAQLRPRQP